VKNFIVMTNTRQWNEAQGVLMKKDLFKGRSEVSKNLFCNYLQKHYIDSSKQTLESPQRVLGINEFSFLFSKKIGKNFEDPNILISQKDFDNFCNWFGPVLQKIRYHKFLLPLWNQGLVWGIIDKKEAERQLKDYGAGTFLIRFSERPGSLAIAYKQNRTNCRNYLIKKSDTIGKGKSLINFLIESVSLLQFLRILDYGNEIGVNTLEKFSALEKIGRKNKQIDTDDILYDEQLMAII